MIIFNSLSWWKQASLMSKRHAPATARNRKPILDVLRAVLPQRGRVLEIAAGSGEHAVYFAGALPGIIWQPTDTDPDCLASIDAWAAEAGLANLRPASRLDVVDGPWPAAKGDDLDTAPDSGTFFDAMFCCNLVHIAPWAACEGLMAVAGRVLKPDGLLVLYGPFAVDGCHTAPTNAAFDASLRAQDPEWGVRDVADVAAEAARHGLELEQRIAMPANNFTLVFRATRSRG